MAMDKVEVLQMNNGWIKLHRKIMDNEYYLSEPFTKMQAWIDLLLNANHKDCVIIIRGIEIRMEKGQIAMSELTLAKRWRWSRAKVRRFLASLISRHQIKQQSTNVTSIISILNYSSYQSNETPNETPNDTPERHQKDTKRYTDKNVKNVKNEEERKYIKEIDDSQSLEDKTRELLKAFIAEYPIIHNIPATESKQRIWLEKLLRLPKEIRHEAMEKALGGSWKDIHDFRQYNQPQALAIPDIDTSSQKERDAEREAQEEEKQRLAFFASDEYKEVLEHQKKMQEQLYEN